MRHYEIRPKDIEGLRKALEAITHNFEFIELLIGGCGWWEHHEAEGMLGLTATPFRFEFAAETTNVVFTTDAPGAAAVHELCTSMKIHLFEGTLEITET